ncbi:Cellular nucleic acid-binding protein-like protein [Yarrowia sp. C11]|nr:Cellular nucleic acid-binding protein-like protein [Yarrowia sp. E02]KAG5369469.1 Cellular nucleic acid-binding protein-like protein [Yarrowia sp. C11]
MEGQGQAQQFRGYSRTCFNCGEFGHQVRACPRVGNPVCYNCGNDGHMSRECTEEPKEKACFKCNQPGHILKECPQNDAIMTDGSAPVIPNVPGAEAPIGGEFGAPRGPSGVCYKCGKPGHFARACRSVPAGGAPPKFGRTQSCYSCGGQGHLSKDCTVGQKCYNCGSMGHVSKECGEAQSRVCYNCKKPGHIAIKCDEVRAA